MTRPKEPSVREGSIAEFTQHQRNARKHNPRNVGTIEKSLQQNGFGRPMLASRERVMLAGNATSEALASIGLEDAIIVETDGTKPIIHIRTDLSVDDEMAVRLALADNRAAELAEWDVDELNRMREEGFNFRDFWTDDEFSRAFGDEDEEEPSSEAQLDAIEYKLVVDCTDEDDQAELLSELESRGRTVKALMA